MSRQGGEHQQHGTARSKMSHGFEDDNSLNLACNSSTTNGCSTKQLPTTRKSWENSAVACWHQYTAHDIAVSAHISYRAKGWCCARLCLCLTSSVHTSCTVHTRFLSQKDRQCREPLSWQHAAGRQITLRKLGSNKREITERFGWRVRRDKEVYGT